MGKLRTIVICASAAFYEHVLEIADELKEQGISVVVPLGAREMQAAGNFDTTRAKTWYQNPDDYSIKADLMRTHFDEISAGDAILVVNDEKHDVPGYIGPNVLMEMSLAWYQRKPIYLLNALPTNTPSEEELKGMQPIILEGDLSKL
jgi:hypothetical protein